MNDTVFSSAPTSAAQAPKAAQRLGQTYRFKDADMDLFFMSALSLGPTGGLDIGQAFHIASHIVDGDADSWVRAFGDYGDQLNAQADAWQQRGWQRESGEVRLKTFASYRAAWQFAVAGSEQFCGLYAQHKTAFATAMEALHVPATFFEVPYQGKQLPGVFLRNPDTSAPVVLVIGGADTCFEDLFLSVGRNLFERGYSVAIADLPGQGITPAAGLHWEIEAEKPIAAVVDLLVERFDAKPGRLALMGLSLGGYFVARAAGHDDRFAAVIASTPFPRPGELFAASVTEAMARATLPDHKVPTSAARRSRQVAFWKSGAASPADFIARSADMIADPARVSVPFLSILGGGDSPVFAAQARAWHHEIRSTRKDFVYLDAASGADGHVQVNNRLRLAQESCGWLREIFAR